MLFMIKCLRFGYKLYYNRFEGESYERDKGLCSIS